MERERIGQWPIPLSRHTGALTCDGGEALRTCNTLHNHSYPDDSLYGRLLRHISLRLSILQKSSLIH